MATAAFEGDLQHLRSLMEQQPVDVNAKVADSKTLLHFACEVNLATKLYHRPLVNLGGPINVRNFVGEVKKKKLRVIKFLLETTNIDLNPV